MQTKKIEVSDLVSINEKMAVVIEIIDENLSKKPRCWIQQEGEKYCVLISDLKLYNNDNGDY